MALRARAVLTENVSKHAQHCLPQHVNGHCPRQCHTAGIRKLMPYTDLVFEALSKVFNLSGPYQCKETLTKT